MADYATTCMIGPRMQARKASLRCHVRGTTIPVPTGSYAARILPLPTAVPTATHRVPPRPPLPAASTAPLRPRTVPTASNRVPPRLLPLPPAANRCPPAVPTAAPTAHRVRCPAAPGGSYRCQPLPTRCTTRYLPLPHAAPTATHPLHPAAPTAANRGLHNVLDRAPSLQLHGRFRAATGRLTRSSGAAWNIPSAVSKPSYKTTGSNFHLQLSFSLQASYLCLPNPRATRKLLAHRKLLWLHLLLSG